MVYRGKPSAGCENCRKAKKRCGLERPACERCVKLKKTCSGYRDTTSLQIQDETMAVTQKAERQRTKAQSQATSNQIDRMTGLLTPEPSVSIRSTPSIDFPLELDVVNDEDDVHSLLLPSDHTFGPVDMSIAPMLMSLKPDPDDIAISYFYRQFVSRTHWSFLRTLHGSTMDPCLELAIKACGMAALQNVENLPMGKEYARSMYGEALGLLNRQLRDPVQSRTDASLVAVSMLGYFENLICDGKHSIQSWKAHVRGATQLLKIRGPNQFNTATGRTLFREIRAQVMIQCLWDDCRPPVFLWEYQPILEALTEPNDWTGQIDVLTRISLDFCALRARMHTLVIGDWEAAQEASELERRFIQWQVDCNTIDIWRYYDLDVKDSQHVWNGKVHAYVCHPIPTAWNTWRCLRIMLSRTQEGLCEQFDFSQPERQEQMSYFRRIRRQMTDDICATVPVQLGHSSPAYSSPCVLITAYGTIWPLFFAGTVSFERVNKSDLQMLNGKPELGSTVSSAAAQALWILSRFEYISKDVGLRWADGVAATLKGDFQIYESVADETMTKSTGFHAAPDNPSSLLGPLDNPLDRNGVPRWLRQIQQANRGVKFLIEKQPSSSVGEEEEAQRNEAWKKRRGPIWLGKNHEAMKQQTGLG